MSNTNETPEICQHAGWGMYQGESGPCPPPAELRRNENGVECPVCGYHLFTFTDSGAVSRVLAVNRETATLARETRAN